MSTAVIAPESNSADDGSSVIGRVLTSLLAPVRMLAAGWNKFFYTPADPAVLSFIRVLAGGMLFYTHVVWGLDLPALFGSQGWNGPDAVAAVTEGRMAPSFWWYVPDSMLLPVHCLCLSIIFFYWIGFATRITSVLSMAITISYSYRAHMANFGLDQINAILTLYMCIGPARRSIVRGSMAGRSKSSKAGRCGWTCFHDPASEEKHHGQPRHSSDSTALLRHLHLCGPVQAAGRCMVERRSGVAGLRNLEYQSVDMTWIAWYPWISDIFTHGTILWEVSFPFAIWVKPLRPYMLFVGFLLHAGHRVGMMDCGPLGSS